MADVPEVLTDFVGKLKALTPSIYLASWVGGTTLVAAVGLRAAGGDWRLLLVALGLAALLWCRVAWVFFWAAREVLRAGYGQQDIVRALTVDIQGQKDRLKVEHLLESITAGDRGAAGGSGSGR